MKAINPENRKPPSNAKQIEPGKCFNLLRFVFLQDLTPSHLQRLKWQMEEHNKSIKNKNPKL